MLCEVRRLTSAESESEQFRDYDKVPTIVPVRWLRHKLQCSPQTLSRHRKILFSACLEYQTIACFRGIESPYLTKRQAELILELAALIKEWRSTKIAIAIYNQSHPSPLDLDVEEKEEQSDVRAV